MAVQESPSLTLWVEGRGKSFAFAIRGMRRLWCEANIRIHAVATVSVVTAGLFVRLSLLEWALLIPCICSVWVTEALNTALELLCDAAVPERHPLIGAAKDVAACAVLITAIGAVLVGLTVFAPRLAPLIWP